jgi:hypothetical protein
MYAKRIKLVIVMVMLVASVLAASIAQAAPPEANPDVATPAVTFIYKKTATLNPGKVWMDESGTHIRGRVDAGTVSGDINGTTLVVYNADFAPGIVPSGQAYGSIQIFSGFTVPVWSGTWAYTISAGKVAGGSMSAQNSAATQLLKVNIVQEMPSGSSGSGLLHKGILQAIGRD